MKLTRGIRRFAAVLTLIGLAAMLSGCAGQFVVLDPKGVVGRHQLDLILISTLLCLVIIVPVLVLTFTIAWRYRSKAGSKAAYRPDWEHSTKLELLWWGIPILIIVILASVTVHYTYKLEPSKPLESDKKPIVIQVTSLDWKWLFQYPEQGIATVNYVQFPEDVPVRFELTSDAPMNSFWIPQLGGQIYTMSGMAMKLNLMADEPGTYMGMGANFSGKEFGKMRFDARVTSQADFDKWVENVKRTAPALTQEGYDKLAEPGTTGTQDYSSIPEGLFDRIVTKYSGGGTGHQHGGAASTEEDMKDMKDMKDMPMPESGSGSESASEHQHH
ncbi:ubiquinol oxidase subunit II [Cohnella sp. CFH 77786]|uniref:ubiquinol oxidase subunit II n=1 Tax=Cohnella sp. CFH 77786 TaxID=2662265 RepID=UPI001C608F75|nr:ubiquinol oxidase subunit II [Cohnella sp. CFH 77786]MBW5445993.1 ubiquinol oxidase subunit II [Cohnella sp. CFH 77786]